MNRRALSAPMPLAAPVMTQTLPSSLTPPPAASYRSARYARASSTSAAIIGDVASASGCHWTPSAKRFPGASIASGRSSIVAQPVTSNPSPIRSTPWWWCDFVPCISSRAARAASEPCCQPHVVVGVVERAERAAVVLVAEVVGQVLVERAAARDVHHLHAAADAEERHVALHRPARERELERVALRHRPGGRLVRLGAVARRVHVGAAGEQQAVDQVEQRFGLLDRGRVGRQHQRDAAGALDGVDVAAREQHRLLVPDAPARALQRGAQPDHRLHSRSNPRNRSQSVTAASNARSSTSA